jgi:hypothetical protein
MYLSIKCWIYETIWVSNYLLIELRSRPISICGYLLVLKPNDCVEKEKKCRKYQEKF